MDEEYSETNTYNDFQVEFNYVTGDEGSSNILSIKGTEYSDTLKPVIHSA